MNITKSCGTNNISLRKEILKGNKFPLKTNLITNKVIYITLICLNNVRYFFLSIFRYYSSNKTRNLAILGKLLIIKKLT